MNENSFSWDNEVIDNISNEKLPSDMLDRAKYAFFLTNYLVEKGKCKDGYVLNINATWGSGKTYFLKRWMHDIKKSHPAVYIDAWKQDYSDDPMLTVISSIIEQLKKQLPIANQYSEKIASNFLKFIKAASPSITKGIIKKISGIELDDISNVIENSKDNEDEHFISQDIASSIATALIAEHNKKLESVEHLRKELAEWICAINSLSNHLSLPAFVFIDELDRCRPNYAVEMLETIKHFFHVTNIVFIIATDTEQLQHAVKVVYGSDFDAGTYLSRFFKRRFSLNNVSRGNFVQAYLSDIDNLPNSASRCWPLIMTKIDLCSGIANVADCFQLSLRDTEQLCDKIYSVLTNTNKSFDFYFLCVLFILHEKYHDIYTKWFKLPGFITEEPLIGTYRHGEPWHEYIYYAEIQTGVSINRKILYTPHFEGISNYSHHPQRVSIYSITLCDLLINAKKYIRELSVEEKNKMKSSIPIQTSSLENRFDKYRKEQFLLELEANESDYKNWVELATSFE
ncbi:NTPase [Vibrio parahaemolyticus]|uniref:KAP family P-loop NTPase fold protein n=3 Tax=Vibrio parahaemolyticus TaxID=670 RepID=UPI00039F12F7|nr:P-loop NTPase fold protein [Vibrio parahaemolyticus]EKH9213027.1 NTPase [Vibrio parahaemolyticus]KAB5598013.1 NTPase [Vibrio parahaemolyticus]MBY4653709.1 KAP family NTPase [Vibrio parahaemolyticus]MCI9696773.1 NTPase [Vibrio parahaemolyticus]MCI9711355.1 NTPase [Vibrio parahaemolyticus]